MQTPSRFNSAILSRIERSNCCFSSSSLMRGATSFIAKSRTVCCIALWSSVNSKSIILFLHYWFDFLQDTLCEEADYFILFSGMLEVQKLKSILHYKQRSTK